MLTEVDLSSSRAAKKAKVIAPVADFFKPSPKKSAPSGTKPAGPSTAGPSSPPKKNGKPVHPMFAKPSVKKEEDEYEDGHAEELEEEGEDEISDEEEQEQEGKAAQKL